MCNLLGRPLGKPQHDGARNGSPVAAHTSGAVRHAVEVETVGELLRASLVEHSDIGPGKGARNCADFAPARELTASSPCVC